MDHKRDCTCDRCLKAKEVEQRGKPKRRIPRAILEEFLEKKAKEEEVELWKGIMTVECPKCRHHVKVKVGPRIKCPACMALIE